MKLEAKPYKGYLPFLRAILLVFQKKTLDITMLGAFIAIACECDWDIKHSTYGCLVKSDSYLATRWGCNLSTVHRRKKQLVGLNCLVETDQGYLRLNHMEWFQIQVAKTLGKEPFANSQDFIAETQKIVAQMQPKIANMQEKRGQNSLQSSNVSYKGNIRLSHSDVDVIDDEELDRIKNEIDKLNNDIQF